MSNFMAMLVLFVSFDAAASTVLYPAPAGASLSADYTVKVNGQTISVYRGLRQGLNYSFAYFDFSGTVNVEVTIASPWMRTPIIRPTSKGIAYTLNNKTVSFSLSNPANISVEPDQGSIIDAPPLILFANPLEVNPPRQGDPGVVYYGPGYHNPPGGVINLGSNSTLYIAGGAVVNAQVNASGNNIRIAGRGILDSKDWAFGTADNILHFDNVTNSTVEGIIAKDSPTWTFRLLQCDYITVNNLKILSTSHENATDGIDIVNSSHITISDSFVRSHDDAIAIKGFDTYPVNPNPHVSLTDGRGLDTINIARTVLWTDGANGFRIGCESHAAYMRNFTFTDIDVIHFSQYNWIVTLQPAENMPIENVRFENVRAEYDWGSSGNFIELRPQVTQWSNPPEGRIQGVYFKNVALSGYRNPNTMGNIQVDGPSAAHDVNGVTFDNVTRYGQTTAANSPNVSVTGYTSNIVFGAGAPPPPPPPGGDTQSPSVPAGLSAQAASSSQINLSWNASSDNVGVAGYKIFRGGAQIATTAGTSYANTGLTASTAYSYTVAAYDAAGNTSGESAPASATTSAVAPPAACPSPANPNAYSASADYSGIQGCRQWSYRDSTGASMSFDAPNNRWQGSETYLWLYADGGHPGNGPDAVRRWTAPAAGSVRITGGASDGDAGGGDGVSVSIKKGASVLWQQAIANGNTVGFGYDLTAAVAAGETIDFIINKVGDNGYDSTPFNPMITFSAAPASDTQAPSVPSNMSAQAASSSQINLTWSASTDNVGVTGYKIFRAGTQIATTVGTSYSNTGLTASTAYSYTVAAYDAAGNTSGQSAAASAATQAPPSSLTCPEPGSGAFSACYFNNMTLDAAGLALARSEAAINFNWGAGSPDPSVSVDNFSARWQGNFVFNAGDYAFSMTVDDGGRLFVDGAPAIDTWINQAATTYTVTRAMTAGTHLITMEYYENAYDATARLSWSQAAGTPPGASCDANGDGSTNVVDVQLSVNQALGAASCAADINRDGACNVVDVQRVVNAALGGACVTGQ